MGVTSLTPYVCVIVKVVTVTIFILQPIIISLTKYVGGNKD